MPGSPHTSKRGKGRAPTDWPSYPGSSTSSASETVATDRSRSRHGRRPPPSGRRRNARPTSSACATDVQKRPAEPNRANEAPLGVTVCELVPEAASAIPLAGSDLESDLVLTVLGSARARAQAGRRQDPPPKRSAASNDKSHASCSTHSKRERLDLGATLAQAVVACLVACGRKKRSSSPGSSDVGEAPIVPSWVERFVSLARLRWPP